MFPTDRCLRIGDSIRDSCCESFRTTRVPLTTTTPTTLRRAPVRRARSFRARSVPTTTPLRAPRRDIPAFLFEFSTLRAFSRSGRGQDADQRAEPSTSAVLPSRHPGSRGPARSGGVESGPNRSARSVIHTHRTAVPGSSPASQPEPHAALFPVGQGSPPPF